MISDSAGASPIRAELIKRLWQGRDPFQTLAPTVGPDLQGWSGSRDPWLEQAVLELRPRIIIEIGVWKGASALFMAETMRRHDVPGVVVAVDTWLGSAEHWLRPDWFQALGGVDGRATTKDVFFANVAAAGLQDYVLPLPLDSLNAAELFGQSGLRADLIHVDAGHDENSIYADLIAWWKNLRPGGKLIGDDYHADGDAWPGVRRAFDRFCEERAIPCEVKTPKVRLTYAGDAAPEFDSGRVRARPDPFDDLKDLPETLEYTGEFGPELILFLPFVNWLSQEGLLRGRRILSYRGMKCFYEDLDCAEVVEKANPRTYLQPHERAVWLPVKNEHDFDARRPSTRHLWPDLRAKFRAAETRTEIGGSGKPLLIIHNKFADEWGVGPVNYIPIETLETIFRLLKHEFTVVYIRHGMSAPRGGFVDDHNETLPGFDDRSLLKRHPEVLNFDDLFSEHVAATGDDDMNRFKVTLMARCYRFISCQGGGAHQIALFRGSILVVLHRRGSEENWAYHRGYYSFAARNPPLLSVCVDDDELIRSIPIFIGSFVVGDLCMPAPGSAPIFDALSPASVVDRLSRKRATEAGEGPA